MSRPLYIARFQWQFLKGDINRAHLPDGNEALKACKSVHIFLTRGRENGNLFKLSFNWFQISLPFCEATGFARCFVACFTWELFENWRKQMHWNQDSITTQTWALPHCSDLMLISSHLFPIRTVVWNLDKFPVLRWLTDCSEEVL